MNAKILIQNGNDWFEFSMSKTGQLDYEGKWEYDALPDVQDYQKISSSTYFSPSWYVFIQDKLNFNPKLFVAPDVDVSEKATFDYLVHVGALIAAVQAKDSLLAGELFLRRREVFERFAQLTQYIMAPLCVEVLFSLCYGKMQNVDPESIPLILESAKEKLAGNAGLEKAGHIRTLAAKIIREAKPKKMSYASKLCSLGNNKIVVEVTV